MGRCCAPGIEGSPTRAWLARPYGSSTPGCSAANAGRRVGPVRLGPRVRDSTPGATQRRDASSRRIGAMSPGTVGKANQALDTRDHQHNSGRYPFAGKCRLGCWSVGYESIVSVGELAAPPAAWAVRPGSVKRCELGGQPNWPPKVLDSGRHLGGSHDHRVYPVHRSCRMRRPGRCQPRRSLGTGEYSCGRQSVRQQLAGGLPHSRSRRDRTRFIRVVVQEHESHNVQHLWLPRT